MSTLVSEPAAIATIDVAQREGESLVTQVNELVVCDQESFGMADAYLGAIKTFIKQVDALTKPVIDAAKAAYDAARLQRTTLVAPAEEAEKSLKAKLVAYDREQKRLAEEAAVRARDEQRRQQAEADRRAEEERLAARLDAEIDGTPELDPEPPVMAMPVIVPPVLVERPRAAGLSFRDNWSASVTDKMALIRAVAEGKASPEFLVPNMTALNQQAKSLKTSLAIPGVEAVNNPVAAKTV